MVDAIESRLTENSFLGGSQPCNEDNSEFVKLAGAAPDAGSHPNAAAWFNLISLFTEPVRGSWGDAVAEAPAVSIDVKIGLSKGQLISYSSRLLIFFWHSLIYLSIICIGIG